MINIEKLIHQVHHKHTCWSNIMTPDSGVSYYDYAKRAKELGQKVLASGEHGWQGNYYEAYEVAKENDDDYINRVEDELSIKNLSNLICKFTNKKQKIKYYESLKGQYLFCERYDLKFIFSTEAYWVKNRFEQDNTNAHIILCAKNEKGRRAINRVLSEANETGYYYKPRLDLELIFSLPPEDVFITSSCVMFWQYEDINEIVLKLHDYFKENFMLEVQYHDTDSQKQLNKKIIELSKKHGIKIIMGTDSHYINPEDYIERDNLLEAKGIVYESENGWFLDYPDTKTAFQRFLNQGILSLQEIYEAINNTNILLTFEDIAFNKDIKLPTLYPNKTQEEKNNILSNLIWKLWEEQKHEIPVKKHSHYESEIRKELSEIITCGMADYFLIDYYMVKRAIEKGGVITPSGRGSAVSFYINKLLGLTKVDRISAKVHMYPERFMTASRILESGNLPD